MLFVLFNSFPNHRIVRDDLKSLCVTLVYSPCLVCILEGCQGHSRVDIKLATKLDYILLADICTIFQMPQMFCAQFWQ